MLHTRTSSGKRCIGNQWRCRCGLRPLSMVIMLPPKVAASTSTPPLSPEDAAASGEYV
jgi:hypothetical protein